MSQKNVEKELLTEQKMRSLFGAEYKNIVYFNYDAGTWNRNSYLGFSMGNQDIDTRNAVAMRRVLEIDKRMNNFEIVAAVTMSVSDDVYPGTQNVVLAPKYKRSRNIVGTILLRDKATGKILNPQKTWFGVESFEKMSAAAFFGADGFVYQLSQNSQIRDKFILGVIEKCR